MFIIINKYIIAKKENYERIVSKSFPLMSSWHILFNILGFTGWLISSSTDGTAECWP